MLKTAVNVKPGDYCRAHKELIMGCSGKGRPTCDAGECLFGAEPCPNGNHWKAECCACLFCHGK